MARYKASWLREVKRFEETMRPHVAEPNDVGLAQFHAFESCGIRPTTPDPYFELLLGGKKQWEWTLNDYEAAYYYKPGPYGMTKWDGWNQLEKDFAGDPAGLAQVRARVLGGHGRAKTYGR